MILFLTLGCVLTLDTLDKTLDEPGPVTAVDVHLNSGDIDAGGDPDSTGATAKMHAEFSGDEPSLSHDVDADGVFSIESLCPEGIVICSVTADVTMPAAVPLKALTDSGDVSAHDLIGTLDLETGSGDVTLDTVSGDATLSTGSGDIVAKRVAFTTVDADTGSGDITARFTAVPTSVVFETGSGDIELTVPAGTYALSIDTGSGDQHVDDGIVIDASAPNVLDLTTGSGDVLVHAD